MPSYKIVSDTLLGSTSGIKWITLDTGDVGLWKPWNEQEYGSEQTYYIIAQYFSLPVSKCVTVEDGFASLVSYNKRYRQVHAFDLGCDYSLIKLAGQFPCCRDDLVKLSFVDAICNNTDRHEGNLALLENSRGTIVGLCPVYDNCTCFGNSSGRQSLLPLTENRIWHNDDVFLNLIKRGIVSFEDAEKFLSDDFEGAIHGTYYFDWAMNRREHLISLLL